MAIQKVSEKSAVTTLLLCVFLGHLGIHRFYAGKWLTGLLMLVTLGGLGIWYFVDVALIVSNRFTDCRGDLIELAKKPVQFKTIMSIFTVFIAIVYGFIIGSIAMTAIATSALVDVAENQLKALKAGDIKTAYTYTAADFQKNTSIQSFGDFVKKYRLDTNENVAFMSRSMLNNDGFVLGKLTLKDGTVYVIQYRLHKDGDQWKVVSVAIGVPNMPNNGKNVDQVTQSNKPTSRLSKPALAIPTADAPKKAQ